MLKHGLKHARLTKLLMTVMHELSELAEKKQSVRSSSKSAILLLWFTSTGNCRKYSLMNIKLENNLLNEKNTRMTGLIFSLC